MIRISEQGPKLFIFSPQLSGKVVSRITKSAVYYSVPLHNIAFRLLITVFDSLVLYYVSPGYEFGCLFRTWFSNASLLHQTVTVDIVYFE